MSELPTLYEYYTKPDIKSGLKAEGETFHLNEKPFTIHSGAIHYFRVHPDYWRDRLRKLRAGNLNCVETYFPWNLHEPKENFYEFGQSKTDWENFCDIEKFLKIAQEEDLFVIARPGPYICSEWEFGGLPPWLLKENIKIRTSDEKFIQKVDKYFKELFKILSKFQFTLGGSIIAFQIENEYGNVKEDNKPIDINYLKILKEIYLKNNIKELLFTSDTPSQGNYGSLPNTLITANFQTNAKKELDILKTYQLNKPSLVMEFWTGWYDNWGGNHQTRSNEIISNTLKEILSYPSSVNLYMFHGGTSFGFMNGGDFENSKSDNSNIKLDTTSYDYDAPLKENGDYGEKYYSFKKIFEEFSKIKFKTPEIPKLTQRKIYNNVILKQQININNLIKNTNKFLSKKTLFMEKINQNYGYIIYRKTNLNISKGSILKIKNHVKDTVLILINNQLISPILNKKEDLENFGFWKLKDSTLNLPANSNATLDIIIENFGRINYGKLYQFNQNKGLDEDQVFLDDESLRDWEIYSLTFDKKFNFGLDGWEDVDGYFGPKLYKGILMVDDKKDTYVDMRGWVKGIVIVNGFVLGRYFKFGPQKTLYLPGPFLKEGENEILIFEHFKGLEEIKFCTEPIFECL